MSTGREAAALAEAAVALTVATLLRRALPMRRWAGLLGRCAPAPAQLPLTAATGAPERSVAVALVRVGRRLPFTTSCLDRAVAGQLLLRRRRRRAVVVIGLDRADPAQLPHAWLLAGDGVVLGGDVLDRYAATTTFTPLTR